MTDARQTGTRSPQPRTSSAAPAQADPHDEGGHGHSVAAWTAVGVILLGCLVMSVAVVAALVWLFVVGAVIVVVGAVLGKVMSAMGFGPNITIDSAAEDGGPGKDGGPGSRQPEGVR